MLLHNILYENQRAFYSFCKLCLLLLFQLAKFREVKDGDGKDMVDNFRDPQALNGRTVSIHDFLSV